MWYVNYTVIEKRKIYLKFLTNFLMQLNFYLE